MPCTSPTESQSKIASPHKKGLFRTFRVPRCNQGSFQNLTVVGMGGRSPQLLWILVGALIVMWNPECTEQSLRERVVFLSSFNIAPAVRVIARAASVSPSP